MKVFENKLTNNFGMRIYERDQLARIGCIKHAIENLVCSCSNEVVARRYFPFASTLRGKENLKIS